MNLEGRRESTNVDDRRGKRVVAGAGMGIGGIIIAGIIALMLGKNPVEVIQNMGALTLNRCNPLPHTEAVPTVVS